MPSLQNAAPRAAHRRGVEPVSKAEIAPSIPSGREERAELTGNIKVTRDDWLKTAMDVLVSQGVEQVKVLPIGERLGVSRSSFYWYFKSRRHLLDTLLDTWERTNTGAIVVQADAPARTITEAVCNLFRCFIDPGGFDHRLDFAIREWSRRSGAVRRILDTSDHARLEAITQMFVRHGYEDHEAKTRARILYYMQIGYYAADLQEPLEQRLAHLPGYLLGFTGQKPLPHEIDEFRAYAKSKQGMISR